MSIKEKLLDRLLQKPTDFKYDEVKTLLGKYGYKEDTRGSTSGSRIAFVNSTTNHIIRFHKPHPGSILRKYQIDLLIKELESQGVIRY